MTDRVFDKAFSHTMQFEGGYVHDRNDPGGETKYGISKRQFPRLNIKDLSIAQAKDIYYDHYWKNYFWSDLKDYDRVAMKLFDMGVNMGPGTATILFKRAIVGLSGTTLPGGRRSSLTEALRRLKQYREDAVLDSLVEVMLDRYKRIIERNPRMGRYRRGWFRRARSIP